MVISEGIPYRMDIMINKLGLNASQFAAKLDVQRSSISHIISGRNKPGYEIIVKILDAFPQINIEWLLNGRGEMLKKSNSKPANSLFSTVESDPPPVYRKPDKLSGAVSVSEERNENSTVTEVNIGKIVVFYSDGTFESYNPKG